MGLWQDGINKVLNRANSGFPEELKTLYRPKKGDKPTGETPHRSQTMEKTTTQSDSKYTNKAGLGDLPPICNLDVGDILQGVLDDARTMTRKGDKKGEEEKKQIALHFSLVSDVTLSQGSKRKKTYKRVEFASGDKVCVTVGGNLSTLLKDMVLKVTGAEVSEDLTAADVLTLKGKDMQLTRLEDGEIQKGTWKGNAVKRFTLNWA